MLPLCPHRWWAGEWQLCSSSCGPGGLSRRAVLCIHSVGLDEQSALGPPACEHLPRPPAETPCNRDVPCPATWAVGNWSEVSSMMRGGPAPALPSVLGYREAETAFGEPLLPGTVVGGAWGIPGPAPSPKPQGLGCPGQPWPQVMVSSWSGQERAAWGPVH